MIQKVLLVALIAIGLTTGLQEVSKSVQHTLTQAKCAMAQETVCIYHETEELK